MFSKLSSLHQISMGTVFSPFPPKLLSSPGVTLVNTLLSICRREIVLLYEDLLTPL